MTLKGKPEILVISNNLLVHTQLARENDADRHEISSSKEKLLPQNELYF
jgi:hypothetical protein